ncbi:DUF3108 domain-containing protein [Massilia sp. G4R7]|uniref:DUF3108 domain-containing protein n=1 Tax=Massilia phyllostachyos TaxID=2898585 RepID=A0ABS8Q5Z2_9BURK|nr:DUF3108 domain-containing protein [Massilia phyllostachyos]MCD2517161.1 DUF3108 domain-containing protein [Massilia phyllostachyos]
MRSPFSPQRWRALVFGTLVVLVHWLALGWLTAGTQGLALPMRDGEGLVSVAELLPMQAAPAPAPDFAPPPPPKMAQPPLPDFEPLPSNMVVQDAIAPPATPPGPPAPPPEAPPAPDAAPAIAAAAPVLLPSAEGEAAPVVHTIRRYKVDVPPPADITYEVARKDADGTTWSGEAKLAWQLAEQGYRMRFEAGIKVVFARVNLVVLTSEGHVGNTGFAPVTMTEKRRGRSQTATHFDWPANRVTFSASEARYDLLPGAQDKATVPLQLAAIARGDAAQLTGDIDMFVGEERYGSVYTFNVVGPEEIDTPVGRLQTVRIARPPKQGSYKSRLDIWLSPAHGWIPVKIQSSEANGAVTIQTVRHIDMNKTGST